MRDTIRIQSNIKKNPECIQRVHRQEKLVIGNNKLSYLSIIYNKNNKLAFQDRRCDTKTCEE